jgi:hypothetical protein
MSRLATVSLREHVDNSLLGEIARLCCLAIVSEGAPAFVEPDPNEVDEDLEPFQDWDVRRGHGLGFFHSDARECATRRVDLRGPTDLDPGPLPMEEAPPEVTASARLLNFAS